MKKWLLIIVLFTVIPSYWAQPVKDVLKRSCGSELALRVHRVCQNRGGHNTHFTARRFRRGIVNECCSNKCRDRDLYAYCSNGKSNGESSESVEVPAWPNDENILNVAESRVSDVVNSRLQVITESTISKVTSESPRYHDVLVNGNVDTKRVDDIIKTLPRNSNDYQVGTVPPEYLMNRYIPSRARIHLIY